MFFTNPLIISLVLRWWEVAPVPYAEIGRPYPIAVVLTGMADLERLPADRLHFTSSVDRINHTIELYKKGLAKEILISGGSGSVLKPELKEAPRLKDYAIAAGVPPQVITVEDNSRNTYENAKFSMDVLKQNGYDKDTFLLVTSAFHMRRAAACFEKENARFVCFSTGYISKPMNWTPHELIVPSLDAMSKWHLLVHEWIGLIAYTLAGYV